LKPSIGGMTYVIAEPVTALATEENDKMKTTVKTVIAIAGVILAAATWNTPAQAQAPSDPQIVGIVGAANQIDIDHSKLALAKSNNKEVKAFAQQMVMDHTAVQKSVTDLAAKLNVTPADSDTSKGLQAQADETTKLLNGLYGTAFDKAYIDNEVAYHKAVIDAVGNTLIPNAQNAELKAALTGAVPMFHGHLEHAQKVQSDLQGTAGKKTPY
jgi:putative membrane protein